MNIQPVHLSVLIIDSPELVSPNNATGIVMTDTIMKIHFHAGRPPLPARVSSRPACIQPPDIVPSWPNTQKTAARTPSSDFRYHEPSMNCAPTLQILSDLQSFSKKKKKKKHNQHADVLCNSRKPALDGIQNNDLPGMRHLVGDQGQHTPR